jgi:hypothetical protein
MIRGICPLCAGNNIESQDSQLVISPQLYSSNFTTDFYGFQVPTHQNEIWLTFVDRDPHPERQKRPDRSKKYENKISCFEDLDFLPLRL